MAKDEVGVDTSTVYNRSWSPDTASSNDSLTKIYSFVDEGSTVLDVGCSIGQLGGALREKKSCTVYGIDINAYSIEQAKGYLNFALCADITKTPFIEIYPQQRFDYIIFADVLEHLPDAVSTLLHAQEVLSPGGSILISIPNVAHASVRLALLEGRFEYCDLGLLDKTHVRFYTRDSLLELLDKAKLVPIEFDRTYLGARETEITIRERGVISDELIQAIEKEPEGTTYQFLLEAVSVSNDKLRQGVLRRAKVLEDAAQKAIQEKTTLDAVIKKNSSGDYVTDFVSFMNCAKELMNELSRHEGKTVQRIEAVKFELFELKTKMAESDPESIRTDIIQDVLKQVIEKLESGGYTKQKPSFWSRIKYKLLG